jgi:integrase
MPNAEELWEGGYLTRDTRGRATYYIRRQVSGVRYEVSTRCHTARAAFEQLKRFEADPSSFVPGGQPKGEAVLLEAELVGAYLVWSREVKKNTPEWVNKQRLMLAWWADQLGRLDLRRLSLVHHIKPALVEATQRQHRIAVLKAFYGWLRKERGLITVAEDPMFQTMPIPPARPQQWTRDKVIATADLMAVRAHLAQWWRDALDVQAATGWHVTEVARFARMGSVESPPVGDDTQTQAVLLCPQTKAGEPLRTRVLGDVVEAARRLRARGVFTRERYGEAINRACDAAHIERFTPGRLRHTVATHAINSGADPAAVAAFLNHKSSRTTRRFYATHAAAKRVPTLNLAGA